MRRWALIAAGSALALLVAFLAGRYSRPAKVEERVRVETRTVTEWKDRIVEKRVEGPVRIVTHVVTKPGGDRVVERIVERGPVTTDTATDAQGASTTQATSEVVKVVEGARPGWRLQADAGWSKLTPRPDLYGFDFSRRLVGTLWVGAWARTDRTAGISAALEW